MALQISQTLNDAPQVPQGFDPNSPAGKMALLQAQQMAAKNGESAPNAPVVPLPQQGSPASADGVPNLSQPASDTNALGTVNGSQPASANPPTTSNGPIYPTPDQRPIGQFYPTPTGQATLADGSQTPAVQGPAAAPNAGETNGPTPDINSIPPAPPFKDTFFGKLLGGVGGALGDIVGMTATGQELSPALKDLANIPGLGDVLSAFHLDQGFGGWNAANEPGNKTSAPLTVPGQTQAAFSEDPQILAIQQRLPQELKLGAYAGGIMEKKATADQAELEQLKAQRASDAEKLNLVGTGDKVQSQNFKDAVRGKRAINDSLVNAYKVLNNQNSSPQQLETALDEVVKQGNLIDQLKRQPNTAGLATAAANGKLMEYISDPRNVYASSVFKGIVDQQFDNAGVESTEENRQGHQILDVTDPDQLAIWKKFDKNYDPEKENQPFTVHDENSGKNIDSQDFSKSMESAAPRMDALAIAQARQIGDLTGQAATAQSANMLKGMSQEGKKVFQDTLTSLGFGDLAKAVSPPAAPAKPKAKSEF